MSGAAATSKSGIKTYQPGEVLFHDGDTADSLFIIQRGQVRLYKPKGKGFIELAVLRAGEVIGEMAYFDEESGKKRSCSASAITTVEIIEISFAAFGKTMQSLNPWFKTIITTLVQRLKKTNTRIRELEDNQAISYGSKPLGYEFVKPIEVMKVLGTIFLVFKAHGETQGGGIAINRKTLQLYAQELYQIIDVKVETIINLLVQLGWMDIRNDEEGSPNVLLLKNLEYVRQAFIYYNGERHLPEDKKMRIGEKCETLIDHMIQQLGVLPLVDIPNQKEIDGVPPKFSKYYNVAPILSELSAQGKAIDVSHLNDGRNMGLFGDVMVEDGVVLVETDFAKVQKLYPVIRFMNAIKKLNSEKAPGGFD